MRLRHIFDTQLALFFVLFMQSSVGCRSLEPIQKTENKETIDASTGETRTQDREPSPIEKKMHEPTPEKDRPEPSHTEKTKPDSQSENPALLRDGTKVHVRIIIDGDTVYVYAGSQSWPYFKIRMLGYNAPECHKGKNAHGFGCTGDDEKYGLAAYEYLFKLMGKKGLVLTVSCPQKGKTGQICKYDPYKRFLSFLLLPSGENPAIKLLEAGYGTVYTIYYPPHLKELCQAEAIAIREKKGMWVDGREIAKAGMNSNTIRWYYNQAPNRTHDAICSKALGVSFKKLAGEE